MRNQNTKQMDNQRALFKKFFNNSNTGSSHVQVNQNGGGFNPPKFQFNKKKLGLGLINNSEVSESKKIMKEIESVEIESEVINTDHMDSESVLHSDVVDNVEDSVLTTSTWNTLNTINTMSTVKNVSKSDRNRAYDEPTSTRFDYEISVNNNVSSLYSSTLEKNKQKYDLSNQLELFSIQLESIEKEIEVKKSKLDLLMLSFEEKLSKHKRRES